MTPVQEWWKSVIQQLSWPWIPWADNLERRAGCQTVKSSRYVPRDGPELISDIKGLHPLLGEYKQHVQGRVTGSESKLMICDKAVGEKEGFYVNVDDGFHDLADDWK